MATAVHLVVAWVAHHLGGFAPLWANAAGFAIAFLASYLGHFYWTFKSTAGHAASLPRFLVVAAAGFALSNLVTWGTIRAGYSFDIALVSILFTVPPTTWVLSRLWAFRS